MAVDWRGNGLGWQWLGKGKGNNWHGFLDFHGFFLEREEKEEGNNGLRIFLGEGSQLAGDGWGGNLVLGAKGKGEYWHGFGRGASLLVWMF